MFKLVVSFIYLLSVFLAEVIGGGGCCHLSTSLSHFAVHL